MVGGLTLPGGCVSIKLGKAVGRLTLMGGQGLLNTLGRDKKRL